MIIVVDIDGILADFNSSYVPSLILHTGKDLFPPDYDMRMPPCWDYPPVFGYTQEEYKTSFKTACHAPDFWRLLDPEPGAQEFAQRLNAASAVHDIFFVTNRSGAQAKQQTEEWLRDLGIEYPTVIVAADKTPFLRALKTNVFIDDRLITANDTARIAEEEQWPDFRMYLADRSYNQTNETQQRRDDLIVVKDLGEMLQREGL